MTSGESLGQSMRNFEGMGTRSLMAISTFLFELSKYKRRGAVRQRDVADVADMHSGGRQSRNDRSVPNVSVSFLILL